MVLSSAGYPLFLYLHCFQTNYILLYSWLGARTCINYLQATGILYAAYATDQNIALIRLSGNLLISNAMIGNLSYI